MNDLDLRRHQQHSHMVSRANWLPPAVLPMTFILFLTSGFGANTLLALVSITILLLGTALLWRPGEAPILLFIFGYQWIQASTAVFHANWLGVPLSGLFPGGEDVTGATLLSLLGLLVLAIGMRIGTGRIRTDVGRQAKEVALRYPSKRWFLLYLMSAAAATFSLYISRHIPGLSQPLIAFSGIKWAFFFIFSYTIFTNPKSDKLLWVFAFSFEFMLSFGGYFSDFKTVFLVTLLSIAAAGFKLSAKRIALGVFFCLVVVGLGVIWTSVKNDYRIFLSGGSGIHVATLDYGARIGKLAELVGQLNDESLVDGANKFAERLSYVRFFGLVLDYVPQFQPHSHGAIWWDAMSRPFMPRILFPWKSAIDDSERTRQYTGLNVSGVESSTSISIGVMAESYIDFGRYGMMIVLLIYGFTLGRIHRWFLGNKYCSSLLGMGLSFATLFGSYAMESSITKVIGGVVVTFIVSFVIIKYMPKYIGFLRAR